MDDRRLARLVGVAVPGAVWVLGLVNPPRDGLTAAYLGSYTAVLLALVLVDQTAPEGQAALSRRAAWLGAELSLCFLTVQIQGTLVRPALVYLVPASRALLLFGERPGFVLSLWVWIGYGLNVALYLWPDRLGEFSNYFLFFLPPFALAVVLTLAITRQAAARQKLELLYDELARAHAELQQLHARVRETAVVEERNRLAREIHDSLAHYLTVINVQLEGAARLAGDEPERALGQVRKARRLAVECLQEVRRSVSSLRASNVDDLSLPKALRRLADEFGENTGLNVRLQLEVPDHTRLPPEVALALYRAAQEGLTNVQRHARASSVTLSLRALDADFELTVEDDGCGPTGNGGAEPSGFGLLGLREPVALLGGQLGFGPAGSAGSRLTVLVPVER